MQNDMKAFLQAAIEIGLGPRLKSLIDEVESSIEAYPASADPRYLKRLEEQLDRLRNPDLRLLSALTAELCVEDPAHRARLRPIVARMTERHRHLGDLPKGLDEQGGNAAAENISDG
jgi:hypothetical protein